MKFRGIELKENIEAELFVSIEIAVIEDISKLEECGEKLEETLENILRYDTCNLYVDYLSDNWLKVYSDDITMDRDGVKILTKIYNDIVNANLQNVKITIGVYAEDEWFKDENGDYNEYLTTLADLTNNIEY